MYMVEFKAESEKGKIIPENLEYEFCLKKAQPLQVTPFIIHDNRKFAKRAVYG